LCDFLQRKKQRLHWWRDGCRTEGTSSNTLMSLDGGPHWSAIMLEQTWAMIGTPSSGEIACIFDRLGGQSPREHLIAIVQSGLEAAVRLLFADGCHGKSSRNDEGVLVAEATGVRFFEEALAAFVGVLEHQARSRYTLVQVASTEAVLREAAFAHMNGDSDIIANASFAQILSAFKQLAKRDEALTTWGERHFEDSLELRAAMRGFQDEQQTMCGRVACHVENLFHGIDFQFDIRQLDLDVTIYPPLGWGRSLCPPGTPESCPKQLRERPHLAEPVRELFRTVSTRHVAAVVHTLLDLMVRITRTPRDMELRMVSLAAPTPGVPCPRHNAVLRACVGTDPAAQKALGRYLHEIVGFVEDSAEKPGTRWRLQTVSVTRICLAWYMLVAEARQHPLLEVRKALEASQGDWGGPKLDWGDDRDVVRTFAEVQALRRELLGPIAAWALEAALGLFEIPPGAQGGGRFTERSTTEQGSVGGGTSLRAESPILETELRAKLVALLRPEPRTQGVSHTREAVADVLKGSVFAGLDAHDRIRRTVHAGVRSCCARKHYVPRWVCSRCSRGYGCDPDLRESRPGTPRQLYARIPSPVSGKCRPDAEQCRAVGGCAPEVNFNLWRVLRNENPVLFFLHRLVLWKYRWRLEVARWASWDNEGVTTTVVALQRSIRASAERVLREQWKRAHDSELPGYSRMDSNGRAEGEDDSDGDDENGVHQEVGSSSATASRKRTSSKRKWHTWRERNTPRYWNQPELFSRYRGEDYLQIGPQVADYFVFRPVELGQLLELGIFHPSQLVRPEAGHGQSELATDTSVNEVYLFHGAPPKVLSAVARAGFFDQVLNIASWFGTGYYFTPNFCKAHMYAWGDGETSTGRIEKQAPEGDSGEHSLLYARVALGRICHVSRTLSGLTKPPAHCDSFLVIPPDIERWRAVREEAELYPQNHVEVIVFDQLQVYPEFVLRYNLRSTEQKCYSRERES